MHRALEIADKMDVDDTLIVQWTYPRFDSSKRRWLVS